MSPQTSCSGLACLCCSPSCHRCRRCLRLASITTSSAAVPVDTTSVAATKSWYCICPSHHCFGCCCLPVPCFLGEPDLFFSHLPSKQAAAAVVAVAPADALTACQYFFCWESLISSSFLDKSSCCLLLLKLIGKKSFEKLQSTFLLLNKNSNNKTYMGDLKIDL